jgi:hypothetical protein
VLIPSISPNDTIAGKPPPNLTQPRQDGLLEPLLGVGEVTGRIHDISQ